jgi:hypothetical protein
MGEYAKFRGVEIKIGTCEDMYYLRYDQRRMIQPLSNSLNPNDKEVQKIIRFRFPWPDEDDSLPGGNGKGFDPFRTLRIDDVRAEDEDHGKVQFSAQNGYLVSIPCPEGKDRSHGLTIHRNGYGGAVHLFQQAVRGGHLVPIFQCGGCKTMWRVETNEDLAPYIKSLEEKIERESGASKRFYRTILDRMLVSDAA